MRAFVTKVKAGRARGRSAVGRLVLGVAAALAAAEWGCGSGGSVAGPDEGAAVLPQRPPEAASVAGYWRGENDPLGLSWNLIQEGESVRGTSRLAGDHGGNASEGRVVGTVSGSSLSFSDTHDAGGTTATCSVELEGTLVLTEIAPPQPTNPPYGNGYPSYGTGYPIYPQPTPSRQALSGSVEGSVCGRPFSGSVTLFRQ